ncbi:type II secretion system F family protein [Acetivibrio cellulolyticus]|uniref:type II secretion system F family protein n=1 Tax=Acetivibrio cellulolyticus TaxID=35830 RepID=UPI0001E2F129|nr:type II secretion system F family protein [Acetivibrio cellulolyticus]
MIIYLLLASIFISSYFIFYAFVGVFYRNRKVVSIRLDRITKEDVKTLENELNQPLFVRVIRPILDDISKVILRITPKEFKSAFEKKVVNAGNPFNLSMKDWINMQVIIVVILPFITSGVCYYLGLDVRSIVFVGIIEICFGLLFPNLVLNKQIAQRQKKILNSLPDVLDLLTVSVEAGLGFDGALAKVIDKMPGPIAIEFENVLQEMKVGKQKRDALKDMAERVGLHDLTTFVGSIIQADQLGVSIGNVLRIQSEQMREKRRQRAKEKAMKAPVKMLIPMVLFIFPTIFSVLIGPVIIKVIYTFTK